LDKLKIKKDNAVMSLHIAAFVSAEKNPFADKIIVGG